MLDGDRPSVAGTVVGVSLAVVVAVGAAVLATTGAADVAVPAPADAVDSLGAAVAAMLAAAEPDVLPPHAVSTATRATPAPAATARPVRRRMWGRGAREVIPPG